MDDLIAGFTQIIPKTGYQLRLVEMVDLQAGNGRASKPKTESLCWPQDRSATIDYEPVVSQPALFCKFSDLGYTPSSQEILCFANQYGWLGDTESVIDPFDEASMDLTSNGRRVQQKITSAEPLEHWYRQLNHYLPYLELWKAIVSGNEVYLASVIHWYDNHNTVSYGKQGVGSMMIASNGNHPELWRSFSSGELVRPAKVTLSRTINRKLSELCSPALLFNERTYTGSHLYFACKNLLGVIWLQFAKAVESNLEYRRCVECTQPFIPYLGERGKKKKFCTDACKSRNYRAKVKIKKSKPKSFKPGIH